MTNAEVNETGTAVAEVGGTVAPEKKGTKKLRRTKKSAPKGNRRAAAGKGKRKPANGGKTSQNPTAPRPESKGALILVMIGRAKGAALAEIMKATSWQAHSVRGFLSTAAKKHGFKIESAKQEGGGRIYRLAK